MKHIAQNIRKIRENKGFSQEYVAFKLGITQSTYSKIEKDVSNISVKRLFDISAVLDTNPSNLLETSDSSSQSNNNTNSLHTQTALWLDEIKELYEKTLKAQSEHIELLTKTANHTQSSKRKK